MIKLSKPVEDYFKELGKKNKYKANQSDRSMPYDLGFATSSDVYSITSKINRSIAEIPYILNQKIGNEVKIIESGALFDRLHNPNENQTLIEFKNETGLNLLLSGEFYLKNEETVVLSKGVEPLNPQLLEVITKYQGYTNTINGYKIRTDNKEFPIHKDFVTQVKLSNPTLEGSRSMRGLSPLIAGYLSLRGIVNNQTANTSILDNQAVAGLLTNEGINPFTETERNFAQKALDKLFGAAEKFGQIVQGSTSSKYIPLGLTPTQLKLIESKLITFRDLCAIYDVKPMLFSDTQGANFNNLKQAEKSFWQNAVIPNDKLIMIGLQRSLIDPVNKFSGTEYFLSQDTSGILAMQDDMRLEAQKDKTKMEGINIISNMPISVEAKRVLLVSDYGYTEDDANVIFTEQPQTNE